MSAFQRNLAPFALQYRQRVRPTGNSDRVSTLCKQTTYGDVAPKLSITVANRRLHQPRGESVHDRRLGAAASL